MKKKLKDLTKEDIALICKNNYCDDCPLRDTLCCPNYDCDEEVEVPEE